MSAVQFDKNMEVKQTLTGELLSGLPQALENGEFKLYLQPKFSPKDLSVIGAEALTRWIKPDGTVVYPDQFIPIWNPRATSLSWICTSSSRWPSSCSAMHRLGTGCCPLQ